MTPPDYRYGFRVLDGKTGMRRLIEWAVAFRAYLACDDRAEMHREAYLSAFTFGDDFRRHLESNGSTAGFVGPCWSPFVWFDLDRDNIQTALDDTRRLAATIVDQFKLDDNALLLFYSGSKGFHVGIPTCLWNPAPAPAFNRIMRRFAEQFAEVAGIMIDAGVYDRVRLFRAPNSRHPKTGRFKRHIPTADLFELSADAILRFAESPEPIELELPAGNCEPATKLWADCQRQIEDDATAIQQRRSDNGGGAKLNRITLQYIREGADVGDRHRLLYSAARNLGECGASLELATSLLTASALDSGLRPKDVQRQIECGIQDAAQVRP